MTPREDRVRRLMSAKNMPRRGAEIVIDAAMFGKGCLTGAYLAQATYHVSSLTKEEEK